MTRLYTQLCLHCIVCWYKYHYLWFNNFVNTNKDETDLLNCKHLNLSGGHTLYRQWRDVTEIQHNYWRVIGGGIRYQTGLAGTNNQV